MDISNYALLDSNILVYAADKSSPFYKSSKSATHFSKIKEIKVLKPN